jgi:hypothetical protein
MEPCWLSLVGVAVRLCRCTGSSCKVAAAAVAETIASRRNQWPTELGHPSVRHNQFRLPLLPAGWVGTRYIHVGANGQSSSVTHPAGDGMCTAVPNTHALGPRTTVAHAGREEKNGTRYTTLRIVESRSEIRMS